MGTEVKKDKFLWKGSLASRMLPACPGLPPGQKLHMHSEMGFFFFPPFFPEVPLGSRGWGKVTCFLLEHPNTWDSWGGDLTGSVLVYPAVFLLKPGLGQLRFAFREAGSLELYGLEKNNVGIL